MMPGLPARGSKSGYDLLITQRSCPDYLCSKFVAHQPIH